MGGKENLSQPPSPKGYGEPGRHRVHRGGKIRVVNFCIQKYATHHLLPSDSIGGFSLPKADK